MNISVTVMADHRRDASARRLANLVEADHISFDHQRNEWGNGAAALLAHGNTDWHCVIQDDAEPVEGFRHQLEHTIRSTPHRTLISLYTGTGRPLQRRVAAAVNTDATFLQHKGLLWGVGYLIPTADIEPMLAWCKNRREPYDRRIGAWYQHTRRPVLYLNPSLLDHTDTGSLIGHDKHVERRAHRLGTPQWNGRVAQI
jgi:hypothetical protein